MAAPTRTRIRAPLFAVAVCVAALGCDLLPMASTSPSDRLARDLAAAEQVWAGLGIDDYRFTLAYHCFCPFADPLTVTVRDGSVVDVASPNGRRPPDEAIDWWPMTIPAVFATLRDNLDASRISVTFDPPTGIPIKATVDPIANAADDEFSFEITDFQI